MIQRDYLTLTEIAEDLYGPITVSPPGSSPQYRRAWNLVVHDGKIKFHRYGRKDIRIPRSAYERWKRACKAPNGRAK